MKKIFKILGGILLVIFLLVLGLILFIRSPWGQGIIVDKATNYVSDKTGTTVKIEKLFLTFSGNLSLKGLYLEDQVGDTLVYSKSLESGIEIMPLVREGAIHLTRLEWEGLKARVRRSEETQKFNFDFLIDAFSGSEGVQESPASSSENNDLPELEIGPVQLRDLDIVYQDDWMGIDSKVILGRLSLILDAIDLNTMGFAVEDFSFRDSEVFYRQTKAFETSEELDTTSTVLPFLSVDQFFIKNVKAYYESVPDNTIADIILGEFSIALPEADLEGKKILLKEFQLKESKFGLRLPEASPASIDTVSGDRKTDFSWPDWEVEMGRIAIENNQVQFQQGETPPQKGRFNPTSFEFKDFNLMVSQLFLKGKEAGFKLDSFSWQEYSGAKLDELSFDFTLNDQMAGLEKLNFQTSQSKLAGKMELQYPSINAIINNPKKAKILLDLPEFKTHAEEALVFVPEMAQEDYFKILSSKEIKGEFQFNGTLENMEVINSRVQWGEKTRFSAKGRLRNLPEMDKLSFSNGVLEFQTIREDAKQWVDEKEMGFQLPQKIHLKSQLNGDVNNLKTDSNLEMPEGIVQFSGNFKQGKQNSFDVSLDVKDLKLGELLPGQGLGTMTFQIKGKGQGKELAEMSANLSSNFDQLEYSGYDFSGLNLEANLTNGEGNAKIIFKDENLDLDIQTQVHLDSLDAKYEAMVDIQAADLFALGLTQKEIWARLKMKMAYHGNPDDFDVNAHMEEGLLVYDDRSYPLGNFDLKAKMAEDSTHLDLKSLMLNSQLRANQPLAQVMERLSGHFKQYLGDSLSETAADKIPAKMNFNFSFNRAPVLDQVILDGLDKLDEITFAMDFDEEENQFSSELKIPYVQYGSIQVDSLNWNANTDNEKLNFNLALGTFQSGPVQLDKTLINGDMNHGQLVLDFSAYDGGEMAYHLGSEMVFGKDTIEFNLDPDELILNKKNWTVPVDNHLIWTGEGLGFHDFSLGRNDQKITLTDSMEKLETSHVGVLFENFQLSALTGFLNPQKPLGLGRVQGEFIIENPFEKPGLVAALGVEGLQVMEVGLGNLTLNAKSLETNHYDFDLSLKDGGIDLDLNGDYKAQEEGAAMDLNLDLNALQLNVLEMWFGEQLSEGQGSISGNLKVSGNTASPEYQGEFAFRNAAIKVNTLNSSFSLPNESIDIDTEGIYFNGFTVRDEEENDFTINGSVLTSSFANPSFDLKLQADHFQLLNSGKSDNEIFYGKANVNANMDIKGDLNLPRINARLKVNGETDLTFIIPESELEIVEREGVVLFVDRKDTQDLLTKREQERVSSGFTGMQMDAVLEVDPDASFKVVIDERSGDNLLISGRADLNFTMAPNGRMNLSGIYEVQSGHYEMSLYNLVSRKFAINEGSTISWKGNPMDADLNITASYNVETSASELMASQLTGVDAEVARKYRQKLPFVVYLNVGGELIKPQIYFNLDMPEDDRGALGGNVFSRVQQVNNEEGELNRQVFSLLVLGRFFPSAGGESSGGGTAGLARSSVSQVLSGQLNALSSNILGNSGFELDFDLDSYTDYQGGNPQDRTQLNVNARQRLFNDRLIVQVGSQVDLEGSDPNNQGRGAVFGNVSIEYLLTENGRFRLRGFRKNQFESIIDGQLIVTGLALIFNREFNKFIDLWKGDEPAQKEEVEKGPESQNKEADSNGNKEQ
ncbi:translocation/assembly module TamB [Echinicola jeungdonensis]|uniref:Translocation/assembly module TamB domain-containing protein n=1 Tax=Echinicola jeungdonensis TaxID=709343 RepID=A0ABV5J505_9BACT|nr:translocation/assembly module TamB [Echinicola jeungdonensis]MDN3670131.1 translocation/assembly module TamB [Echinicola jeungdonensis]